MKNVLTSLLLLSFVAVAGFGCDSKTDGGEEAAKSEASADAESAKQAEQEANAEEAAQKEQADSGAEPEQAGQWAVSESYGLKFRVPEDWNVVADEQGVSATDPEGSTTVLLAGSKSQELAKSMLNELRAEVTFKDISVEKMGPSTINGMPVFRGTGTGVLDNDEGGQEIQFLGYTIKREGDQTATLFIFSEATMYEAKKDIIQGIAKTLVETSK
jgi:hypothetical protein